jgi:glycosyltransferase involved in cell wall biosynthesis
VPKHQSILVAHQGAELYGSDQMLLLLLKTFSRDNHQVTLHLPHDGPLLSKLPPLHNVIVKPISVLRLNLLATPRAWLNIKQFILNLVTAWKLAQQHDMIIVNSCVVLSYLLVLPFVRKPKFVYMHEITQGLTNLAFQLLLRLTGAKLICNSMATADNYNMIARKHKIILKNTVDLPAAVVPQKQASLPLHILMIGRMSRRKGQVVLLKAIAVLNDFERDSVRLRFVGNSYDENDLYVSELKTLAVKHNVSIEWHDFSDPTPHYEWAHIVIMPSIKPESFGLVILEAMHYHCAIIASRIGALPELVQDQENGFLVQPNNPHELAQALRQYLKKPSLMMTHAQAGQKTAANLNLEHYRRTVQRIVTGDL